MSLLTETTTTDTLIEAIQTRRSIPLKQLSQEPVALEHIQLMLEAANWAPNHGHTEPWRFTVFAGEGRRILSDAFIEAYRLLTPPEKQNPIAEQGQRDRAWEAPVWISIGLVPGMNEQGERRMPEWEELIAVGCAVHNAHLVASSLGLGAKWTSGAVVTHAHVAHRLGLESPARLLGFLYVGHPAIPPSPGLRRPIEEKVRWITSPDQL
jgi:nitroreductase